MLIKTSDIRNYLTVENVREMLSVSGSEVLWKKRPQHHFPTEASMNFFNRKWPGKPVGSFKTKSHKTVKLLNKYEFRVSDLAYIYHHGEYPANFVIHKNMDKLNFSKENLAVAGSLNQRN